MKVLHISSECYPAAKAGGMGDVVGALPIYQNKIDVDASVIIPKYALKWFKDKKFKSVFSGHYQLGEELIKYDIQQLQSKDLGYTFYTIDIPGKFDRNSIYLAEDGHGFKDEPARNIAFQITVLEWLKNGNTNFDLLHCHDHMTGLIPFFIKQSEHFKSLKELPVTFTIHNGSYRGIFEWEVSNFFPKSERKFNGWLDWDGKINSLATAIKCADKVTTVSPSYMQELIDVNDTLQILYQAEKHKCSGILNGTDNNLWNPRKDKMLNTVMENENFTAFKSANKKQLLKKYKLKSRKPLLSFIGRFADQKGVDVFFDAIQQNEQITQNFSILILGSGDPILEKRAKELEAANENNLSAIIAYNEEIARNIYAGSDFMIIPSRFEPCGLNQLFCFRYATVPIVNNVGGLKDTVTDYENGGNGFVFHHLNAEQIANSLSKALVLYKNKSKLKQLRKTILNLDYSWSKSAKQYKKLYDEILTNNRNEN